MATTTVNVNVSAAGNSGEVQFNNAGSFGANANFFWDNTNSRLSIGQGNAPSARLDVRAQGALSTDIVLRVRNSANTRDFLTVNGAGDVYNNGAGGVTSNTFYGELVGRNATGTNNTFIGRAAGQNTTTGSNNTSLGQGAGIGITQGNANTFIGQGAGASTSTGINNTFVGRDCGSLNSSASFSTFMGTNAGLVSTGGENTYLGTNAAINATTGTQNVFLGRNSGNLIASGGNLVLCNNSVMLGFGTRANADNETNQIVIGHNAIGTGSNSVTLGNTSITRTNLRGQVVISGFASAPTGVEGAIYYDTVLKKHYGFDGINWNALY